MRHTTRALPQLLRGAQTQKKEDVHVLPITGAVQEVATQAGEASDSALLTKETE